MTPAMHIVQAGLKLMILLPWLPSAGITDVHYHAQKDLKSKKKKIRSHPYSLSQIPTKTILKRFPLATKVIQ
jgi:hypothetical protein